MFVLINEQIIAVRKWPRPLVEATHWYFFVSLFRLAHELSPLVAT